MGNVYYNIYYRFYLLVRSFGEKETPRYNAVLLLSIFSSLNVITVIIFLMVILGKVIIVDLPKEYLFLLGLLIIGANSYIIFGRKRYEYIEQKYQNEGKSIRIKNNLYALIYVLLSVVFLIMALAYLNFHPIVSNRY